MSDSAVRTKNKKLHKQRHGEVPHFALLSCNFLFLVHYTLFFQFEEFPNNQRKPLRLEVALSSYFLQFAGNLSDHGSKSLQKSIS